MRPLQEKKKLRKQRREEREKEKQQNIQLGLMEPPKDKVRLSNMARVYGAAGVVDATAIELKVRAAQAERQRAHEDRNAARKLTTAERKEKKMKKLFDNEAADVIVQVCSRPQAPASRGCVEPLSLYPVFPAIDVCGAALVRASDVATMLRNSKTLARKK